VCVPQEVYKRIRRGWEYWKKRGVHAQINRFLSILYGMLVHEIKADGSCLFRAFAMAVLGDEERHMEVRESVVAFIRGSDDLRGFIIPEDDGEDCAVYVERYLE
jgi:hypothetical protein